MRVIPTFFAITPERIGSSSFRGAIGLPLRLMSFSGFPVGAAAPPRLLLLELDFDVDAGSQIELHQSIDRLRGRIDDVEQPLVGAHLELLAALLVDMGRAVDREFLDSRRQRNGTADVGA